MRRRLLAYLLILVAIQLVVVSALYASFAPSYWSSFVTSLLLALVNLSLYILISIPLMAVFTFMAPFPLDVDVAGRDIGALSSLLSREGYFVQRRGGRLIVRFDTWVTMSISAGPSLESRCLTSRLEPNSTSVLVLGLLAMFYVLGFLALPVCAMLLIKMDRYSNGYILKALGSEVAPAEPVPRDVRQSLLGGLYEAHSLVNEARQTVAGTKGDIPVLIIAMGMMLGTVLFLAGLGAFGIESGNWLAWGMLCLGITIAACLIVYLALRKGPEAKLSDLDQWIGRLGKRLKEEADEGSFEGEESTVELLMHASKEMPKWLLLRRKGALLRYPGIGVLLFFLLSWAVSFLFNGLTILQYDAIQGLATVAVGAFMAAIACALLLLVRKWNREEQEVIEREWRSRREMLVKLLQGKSASEE